MRGPLKTLLALVAVGLAVASAGCGNKEETITTGETEGAYLDVGGLKYQVQVSRILQPSNPEDRAYLLGLPPGEEELEADESWFAVFIRVQNVTDRPLPSAEEYEIVDTQETVFEPLELSEENVFAYRPVDVGPTSVVPEPDSAAAEGTIQGSLLLFKIPFQNLENRPLEFEIKDPADPRRFGQVSLDV